MIEITFNRWGVPFARFSALSDGCFSRSVKISKNKVYRIGMVLNKVRKDGNNTLKVWIIDHCNFPGWLVPDGCVHPQSQLWRILFHFLRWATQRYAQGRPYKVQRYITSLCFIFAISFLGLSSFPGLKTRATRPADKNSKVESWIPVLDFQNLRPLSYRIPFRIHI